MRTLALCLGLIPCVATAGGLERDVFVEVPCYPDNRFELCPVPVPDLHRPGYLPRTVPALLTYNQVPGRFAMLVTPNIVPYDLAIRDAAIAAAQLCGQEPGEIIVARIDYRERYAPENLESWKFSGTCE